MIFVNHLLITEQIMIHQFQHIILTKKFIFL